MTLAIISLVVTFFLELLQSVHFLQISGLEKYKLLSILNGNSFAWEDLLAYFLGFITILFFQKIKVRGL